MASSSAEQRDQDLQLADANRFEAALRSATSFAMQSGEWLAKQSFRIFGGRVPDLFFARFLADDAGHASVQGNGKYVEEIRVPDAIRARLVIQRGRHGLEEARRIFVNRAGRQGLSSGRPTGLNLRFHVWFPRK